MKIEPLLSHTFLFHCWVCETPFDHSTKEERHHIVPCAYGGEDGPQVSLCDSHHSALHDIALKLYSKKPYYQLLTKSPLQNKRLLYLATVACNARIATEKDPNKSVPTTIYLKGEMLDKLRRLKSVYPKSSKEDLLVAGLNLLYDRHFK
jgi:hypothetical protein